MQNERLSQQITFLLELDKLKRVLRRTKPVGSERYEDSAEHSWHLAMMALLLAEYADETVNVSRVIQMVLIHDIVEIDAGDDVRRTKRDLFGFSKEVVDIPIENHPSQRCQRHDLFGYQLRWIEDIEIKLLRLLSGKRLHG